MKHRVSIRTARKRARMIMAGILGRKLLRSEIVHHIDKNPWNNDPVNLMYLSSSGEHTRIHHTNKKVSDETRKRISAALAGRKGEGTPMWGKYHSDETKKKMREAQSGIKNHRYGKKDLPIEIERKRAAWTGSGNPRYKGLLEHGTCNRYRHGCRCKECRLANAIRARWYREKSITKPAPVSFVDKRR